MSDAKLPVLPASATAERWVYVRNQVSKGKTLILISSFTLAAFIAGAALIGPAIGGIAAAGVIVIGLLIAYAIASSRAEDDFFTAYAAHRGLEHFDGTSSLPPATPLLRKGNKRYTSRQLTGPLPGELEGTMAAYTYEVETRGSKGEKQTTYYHFTVVFSTLPGVADLINEFHCEMRAGFRFLDGLEDTFRSRQRVENESEPVDRRFEIFIGGNDSMNKARQILSPSFLVWLGENSPEKFMFELTNGQLLTVMKGKLRKVVELDELLAANATVARRLIDEAREQV